MRPPPTRRSPRAARSARCTACRSTSRTSSTPRACARRSPPTSTSTTCPRRTRVSVARLKRAGAILIGKTTTPEFGHMPYTEAPLFGRTRNAWAADRTSGGSSGGAAVALAAGVCPIGVGTDAGGSTRIPAACNGVVGFKQSAGVVPHDMSPEAFANVSSINPMARTVMDTALMLEAMAGQHPCDPYSYGVAGDRLRRCRQARRRRLQGMRIAWRPLLGQHGNRQPRCWRRARRRPWRWARSAPPSSRWTTTWSRSSRSGSPIPARCGTPASAICCRNGATG